MDEWLQTIVNDGSTDPDDQAGKLLNWVFVFQ